MVVSRGAGDGHRFAEDDPGGHDDSAADRGSDTKAIQSRVGLENEQADASHTCGGGDRGAQGQALTEQAGGKAGDQQGLRCDDDGRDPTGQPVGGDEQQREERADVERAEHQCAPPPDPLR